MRGNNISEEEFKRCIDEAEKKALHWLWLKKSGKDKVIDAFDDLRNKINECKLKKKEK